MDANKETDRWSEDEFANLQWHDLPIHGVKAVPDRFQLCFDIDYIVEWLCSALEKGPVTFRIAPATLIFDNVRKVSISVASQQGLLTIRELHRTMAERRPGAGVDMSHWEFECEEGRISFDASHFQLLLRSPPVSSNLQCLPSNLRGSLPF